MKKTFGILLLSAVITPVGAQRILSLNSCRQMALRNNKQLGISKLKQDVAENARKSARTKYLPHVSAIGTYEFTSEEISILNDGQKAALGGLGTLVGGTLQNTLGSLVATLPPAAQMQMAQDMANVTAGLNQKGQNIVDMNNGAVDQGVQALHKVEVPASWAEAQDEAVCRSCVDRVVDVIKQKGHTL